MVKFQKVDMSDIEYESVNEYGQVNIGFYEGVIDGVCPIRVESWENDTIKMNSIYIAAAAIKDLSDDAIYEILESHKIYERTDNPFYATIDEYVDVNENKFKVVNIVMGNENTIYVKTNLIFKNYK
ncbi:MAG: hypothetical protein RR458_02375 [Clostridia bacterium]